MHKPVLSQEVIEALNPKPGQTFIDGTIGEGGHALEILKRINPGGTLLGIDWDENAIKKAKANLLKHLVGNRLILAVGNYADLKNWVEDNRLGGTDGILLDLGFGTHTIETSGRGFSFLKNEPLDMRYNPDANELTAEEIINRWSKEKIEEILREYGEERCARRIAENIFVSRKRKRISTTEELVGVILQSVPRSGRIHPATRTFQALRIAVNKELDNLRKTLADAPDILNPDGKIAVISFHSLEDRIVKNFFKDQEKKDILALVAKKPIRPSREEIKNNPGARSAKLRVAKKN